MRYPNLELIEYITENTANELFESELIMSTYHKFKMYVFPQTWSSTALGFDNQCGFSGQAITDAYTVVVEMIPYQSIVNQKKLGFNIKKLDDKVYAVFFDSKLAYMCLNPNQKFFDDLNKMYMKSQKESTEYEDEDGRVSIL